MKMELKIVCECGNCDVYIPIIRDPECDHDVNEIGSQQHSIKESNLLDTIQKQPDELIIRCTSCGTESIVSI